MDEIKNENKENKEYKTKVKKSFVENSSYKLKLFLKNTSGGIGKIKNNDFFRNHIILWLLLFNLLSNLLNWLGLAFFINRTSRNLILHYNVYFGVDRTGNWQESFLMPGLGLALFLLNFYLAYFFYNNKERVASYVILLTSLMIQLSLIISSISVILINY
jgi:hypothetical protein